jgi:cytochrome d ubiquinol oxidase subunit I
VAGVASVITLEAGWTVSEVGRQPWIVYNYMKVDAAATGNTGVWLTFVGIVLLYAGLGITTILVLRGMARRYRETGEGPGHFEESDAPYGPADPALGDASAAEEPVEVGAP